ncbi:MAG: spore germination protein [Thermoactinomyces sp.]
MGTINNILIVKVNNVSNTASINFGNTINVGNDSLTKTLGGSRPIGDFPRNLDFERNVYIDPDLLDQND